MARKAITFIKQYFFMLALAATFIGFSAFKFTDRQAFDDGWYALSYDDEELENPNTPENLKIENHQGSNPGQDCAVNNPDDIACAIFLEFDGTTEMPETVQESNLDGTIEVGRV